MRWLALVFLFFPMLGIAGGADEPEGYHGEPYRGEVPRTLEGAIVVSTETAYALWTTGQIGFVDVLPQAPKPENLPEDTIWIDKPRRTIPGAIWLPNTGYQALAEKDLAYFLEGLETLSEGDLDRPLVFFCLDECWMSWNAAKRAMAHGYRRVYWYPEGTDGWDFEDYPSEELSPWVREGAD